MCLGALLMHQIGRIVFGSSDSHGGAGCSFGHLPPYFENELQAVEWIGPALPQECDELYTRARALIFERGGTLRGAGDQSWTDTHPLKKGGQT
jgi:hypothetical protein